MRVKIIEIIIITFIIIAKVIKLFKLAKLFCVYWEITNRCLAVSRLAAVV